MKYTETDKKIYHIIKSEDMPKAETIADKAGIDIADVNDSLTKLCNDGVLDTVPDIGTLHNPFAYFYYVSTSASPDMVNELES